MNFFTQYENNQLIKSHINLIISNTIFFALQIYILQNLNKLDVINDPISYLFIFGLISSILTMVASVCVYLFSIIRIIILLVSKNINNIIENKFIHFNESMFIVNSVFIIINLSILKIL